MKKFFYYFNIQLLCILTLFFSHSASAAPSAKFTISPAGPIFSEGVKVTLDGSSSTAGSGGALSYAWNCLPQPCNPEITFSTPTSQSTTFIIPTLVAPATSALLTIQLTVTETNTTTSSITTTSTSTTSVPGTTTTTTSVPGTTTTTTSVPTTITSSNSATKEITIQKTNLTGTTAPITVITVNPSGGQTFAEGVPITLSGADSKDVAGGTQLSYKWEITNSSPATFKDKLKLADTTSKNLIFVTPIIDDPTVTEYTLLFKLTISDLSLPVPVNNINSQEITITVKRNNKPVADAGTPKIITIQKDSIIQQGGTIELNGTTSLATYKSNEWTLSPPATYQGTTPDNKITISSPNTLTSSVKIGKDVPPGQYVFTLIVTDTADRKSDASTLTVQIVTKEAQPPTVGDVTLKDNSGNAVVKTAPENTSITLAPANVVDDKVDAAVLKYSWKQDPKDSYQVTLLPSTNVSTVIFQTPILAGTVSSTALHFTLTITDPDNLSIEKQVTVNVSNMDSPPVAVPASDLTTAIGGDTVYLNASHSYSPGGTIQSYLWTWSESTLSMASRFSPQAFILSDPQSANPTFVVPNPPSNATPVGITLNVVNDKKLSGTPTTLNINVNKNTLFLDNFTGAYLINAANKARTTIGIYMPSGDANLVELTPKHPSLLTNNSTLPTGSTTTTTIAPTTGTPTSTNQEPLNIEFGMIKLGIKTRKTGELVTIELQFPDPIPDNLTLWTYTKKGWSESSKDVSFKNNRKNATIALVDGGPNDDDAISNGIILSIIGFADPTPSTTTTAPPGTSSSSGIKDSSSGSKDTKVGCTMNPNTDLDPTFPVLLLMSAWYLHRKRTTSMHQA
ncbi:MAG: JDVT-CTERM domain-containing protein [Magnetococcus sp. YQC-5]